MTAEVAVLNSHGVSLAADSAVTLGQDARKIYTSADKLFQLHQCDPVGVMIYGNANIGGLPWETVIKAFRAELKTDSYDTLSGYADRLIDFLRTNRDIFSKTREERHVALLCASVLMHVREQLKNKIDAEAAKSKAGLSKQEVAALCDDVFTRRLALIRKQPLLDILGEAAADEIRQKYSSDISKAKKEIFGSVPMKRGSSQKLTSLAIEMLARHYFGPMQGGVVVAGFGKKQYLPELIAYEIEEFVLGKPRMVKVDGAAISDDNLGFIVPFAQQEMVHAFMEGANRELMSHIQSSAASLFTGSIEAILAFLRTRDASLADEIEKSVTDPQRQALQKLFADWGKKRDGFWHPVLQIVAALPKDELAAMAEALVNLTKFRRRVTTMRETVGGPIDVAVITKGDGFVWVKRKHYFSPDLNPRVIARYGRS